MKAKRFSSLLLAVAFASALTAVDSHAGSHTWSGAVNGNWSVAGNWSAGGPPAAGETPLNLFFPPGATRLASTNDIVGLQVDSMTITGDGYAFAAGASAGLILKGTGLSVVGNANATFGASMGITLNGFNYFNIASGKQVTVDCPIAGSGILAKIGPGTLRLHGASGNSYSGGTVVNDGILLLECGGVAIRNVLNVGTTNTSIPASVKLAAPEQLANDAAIVVYPSGRLDLNGFVETVGPMTFTGGGVYGNGNSLLVLNSDVTGLYWLGLVDLRAPISLGGTNRTFTAGYGSLMYSVNTISDGAKPAGIIKAGPGSLSLGGSNTYSGVTLINEGRLTVHDSNALGSTNAGTVVANGATLRMEHWTSVGAEPLALNGPGNNNSNGALQAYGTNIWAGPITLLSDSDVRVDLASADLMLAGQISGPGALRKTGPGPLTFNGPVGNSYTSPTIVLEGLLKLAKPQNSNAIAGPLIVGDSNSPSSSATVMLLTHNQIADTSPVTLNANGVLDCWHRVDSIGALRGTGFVQARSGQVNAGGDNSDFTFDGVINGTGDQALIKIGSGTMTLAGAVTSGNSRVNSGRLIVNGNHPGHITVQGSSFLAGTGVVGDLDFTGQGLLRPGTFFGNTPGIINSGALSLTNGAHIYFELYGTTPGSGYDQVNVTGAVDLTDSQLRVRPFASMPMGSKFVVIKNDGTDAVTGTFKDLPEGSIFTTNALQWQITYKGGDGNDVVLTQVTAAPEVRIDGIANDPSSGQMRVNGSGIPGVTYHLWATTNLNSTNWVIIGSAVANNPSRTFTLTDTNWLDYPARFYRFSE